jgi:hypothetical protein
MVMMINEDFVEKYNPWGYGGAALQLADNVVRIKLVGRQQTRLYQALDMEEII